MLPDKYKWIDSIEEKPKMIVEFLKLYGIHEMPGSDNNKTILSWAEEVNLEDIYTNDSIPWCGLEMAVIAKRAGKEIVKNPLWALNWSKFGNPSDTPMFGDILTFKRLSGGHVGLYIAEDYQCYHVGGGNQSDSSTIIRIDKTRLFAARRPIWKIKQPSSVKKYFVGADGKISENES